MTINLNVSIKEITLVLHAIDFSSKRKENHVKFIHKSQYVIFLKAHRENFVLIDVL